MGVALRRAVIELGSKENVVLLLFLHRKSRRQVDKMVVVNRSNLLEFASVCLKCFELFFTLRF